ncbi:Calcineurin-like phosphoesterase domain-containing protein [Sphingomonas antarctica]|uniref:metallophosphoesterase n=1 Tax=Sphingomonas antarctica TaxID=2040274 RepID=UPI0039EBB960
MVFKRLFSRPEPRAHALPAGQRIYAVGDVHGRLDLFEELLAKIRADDGQRGAADTHLVLLGDLVDRGADSAGVVERAMQLCADGKCRVLMGNHEEVLIRTWDGDRRTAGMFSRIGGRETLLSYGVDEAEYDEAGLPELVALTRKHVPAAHIEFMRGFEETILEGDYLFVHAGIRPGIPRNEQSSEDTRWIRREFLEDARDHGAMVVHGHSITGAVDERSNRIGIDTGAFASGVLTAIGLEGAERWFLST